MEKYNVSKIWIHIKNNHKLILNSDSFVKCTEIGNDVKLASISDVLILGMSVFSVISRHDMTFQNNLFPLFSHFSDLKNILHI